MSEWTPIPGFEFYYAINTHGDIWSFYTHKILKPDVTKHGYKCCNLYKNKKGYKKVIHRLVAEIFIPKSGPTLEVNHKDGNKLNNNVDNLEWVTKSQNIRHAYDNGLACSVNRVLTEDQVRQIKLRLRTSETHKSIGKDFNVSSNAVWRISKNITWKHINVD